MEISEVYFHEIFRPPNLEGRSRYANSRRRRYSRHKITSAVPTMKARLSGILKYVLPPRVHPIFKRIYSGIYYEWKGLVLVVHYSLIFRVRTSRRNNTQYHAYLLLTQVEKLQDQAYRWFILFFCLPVQLVLYYKFILWLSIEIFGQPMPRKAQ